MNNNVAVYGVAVVDCTAVLCRGYRGPRGSRRPALEPGGNRGGHRSGAAPFAEDSAEKVRLLLALQLLARIAARCDIRCQRLAATLMTAGASTVAERKRYSLAASASWALPLAHEHPPPQASSTGGGPGGYRGATGVGRAIADALWLRRRRRSAGELENGRPSPLNPAFNNLHLLSIICALQG